MQFSQKSSTGGGSGGSQVCVVSAGSVEWGHVLQLCQHAPAAGLARTPCCLRACLPPPWSLHGCCGLASPPLCSLHGLQTRHKAGHDLTFQRHVPKFLQKYSHLLGKGAKVGTRACCRPH